MSESNTPPEADLNEIHDWAKHATFSLNFIESDNVIEVVTSYGRPIARLKYNAGWRLYYPSDDRLTWTPYDDYTCSKPPLDILEKHPGGLAGAPPDFGDNEN